MASGVLTLAIENSNPGAGRPGVARAAGAEPGAARAGVAVLEAIPGTALRVLGEEPLRFASPFDDDLMAAIDRLMGRLALKPRDLRRVAFSSGPGGFTGLRIAAAVVKGICEVTGAEAYAVPTALGVWGGTPRDVRTTHAVVVCLAWKRQDVWREVFPAGVEGGRAAAARRAELVSLDHLLRGVPTPAVLVMDHELESQVRERLGPDVRILSPSFDAAAIAEASLSMAPTDLLSLAPMYPREPEAVRKWKSR